MPDGCNVVKRLLEPGTTQKAHSPAPEAEKLQASGEVGKAYKGRGNSGGGDRGEGAGLCPRRIAVGWEAGPGARARSRVCLG